MNEFEVYTAPSGAVIVNETAFSGHDIFDAFPQKGANAEVFSAMEAWATASKPRQDNTYSGILARDEFIAPTGPIEQIRLARKALDDDVVGNAADITESLAVSSMSIECVDDDQRYIWNRIAADLDFDSRLREAWQALFSDSGFVVAARWGTETYKLEGNTPGGLPRRKTYTVNTPTALTLLDATKIIPVGSTAFGGEGLAYHASPEEALAFDDILRPRDDERRARTHGIPLNYRTNSTRWGRGYDDEPSAGLDAATVRLLIRRRYQPDQVERSELAELGIDSNRLYLLDNRYVFRHTVTRPGYRRFPRIRLKRVFALLDLKRALHQMDRRHLVGAANFIVVITQGSDNDQLSPEKKAQEQAHLKANARTIGQIPILVGDHRLKVEIVSPPTDATLQRERYDILDSRILSTCLGTFAATGQDVDDPTKLAQVVAAGLAGRRKMMARAFDSQVLRLIRDANPGILTDRAKIVFHPRQISLAFDNALASFILEARNSGDLSRETSLGTFGFDQADEARHRQREKDLGYDDVFETKPPSGGRDNMPRPDEDDGDGDRRMTPRQGGRLRGGHTRPGSGHGQEPRNPHRSETRRETLRAELAAFERSELIKGYATEFAIPNRHQMKKADLIEAIANHVENTAHPEADEHDEEQP